MAKLGQLLICIFCISLLWAEEAKELRGIWITRFEWPDKDPEKCRANIVRCFEDLKKANFNAAFFQVRGAADVLYPSEIEPWSHLIGGKDPGFDPLELAIKEAHKHGIQLHAYINPVPMVLWLDGTPPKNKNHIFYQHGPNTKDPWVCIDEDGKVMDAKSAAYHYFSLGIPPVQKYLRNVIRDLVSRYDIDGLHIDRIRYPGPNYSHDKISKERFHGHGNPNHYSWQNWQREQLNKFVNDVYTEVMVLKPEVIVSCAAWGIYSRYNVPGYDGFSSGYHDYFQDSWFWAKSGAMDLVVPMIYWDMKNPKPNYDELVEDFARGIGKERFVGGQRMYGEPWPVSENIRQIEYSRKFQLPGTVIFSYESAVQKNGFAQIHNKLYQKPAAIPSLKHPFSKRSIIAGKVKNTEGVPLTDAWVTLKTKESTRTWVSGADGYFSFVNVPTGKITLEVTHNNGRTKSIDLELKKPTVRTIDIIVSVKKTSSIPIDIWKIHNNGSHCHLLARTNPKNKATINGQKTRVNVNGMFALDNISLNKGKNEILLEVTNPQGQKQQRIVEITATDTLPNFIPPKIEVEEIAIFSTAKVIEDKTGITYGLHDVRLGGPFVTEVDSGTLLEVVAKKSGHYKIKLAHSLYGWVKQKNVALLEKGAAAKGYFTYCNIKGNKDYDIIHIPMNAKVPYALTSETNSGNAIIVNLYQTHHATTWFAHRTSAKIIGEVSGKQVQEGWYQLHIPIKSKQIWGFWHERNQSGITIFVKRPPNIAANPLQDLKIALEAGHGGSNTGAVGVSNALEKDVNRKAVDILQAQLEAKGATVILLRFRDTYPSHQQRLDKAISENADLLISLHANATGTARGFNRISGVSTFYKHSHNFLLAKKIYNHLLQLGWEEFGVVGNFNYKPLRDTHFPSVLIEQGFMSNPFDESRLLDKSFQEKQTKVIIEGLEQFLQSVKE